MKILIVAARFPPCNVISSLRPYSWAKYWSKEGHQVDVLTTKSKYANNDLKFRLEGFNVDYVAIPFLDLIHSFCLKKDVSPTNHGDMRKNSLLDQLRARGVFNTCRMPDIHDLWALKCISKLFNAKYDAVISTGWPYSTHFVGYFLKITGRTSKWICDWRDPWIFSNPLFVGLPLFDSIEKIIEKRFHAVANNVTTVTETWANCLAKVYKRKVDVIYNGFAPEDHESLEKTYFWKNEKRKFRIVHTGSIYKYRVPDPFFEAVNLLINEGVLNVDNFEIDFAGDFPAKAIETFNLLSYCKDYGRIAREDALRMQRDADCLLFMDWADNNQSGVLSAKIYEYLYSDTPILSVGGKKDSLASNLITKSASGFVFESESALIASKLKEMFVTPKMEIINSDKDFIMSFTRENQARLLLNLIR